jgi:hypothetical protein
LFTKGVLYDGYGAVHTQQYDVTGVFGIMFSAANFFTLHVAE